MTTVTPSRRERLRTATVTEIKAAARALLVAGGPTRISLRAIARDVGMTAPAIYRYFPSLDALVGDLVADLYAELGGAVDAARLDAPADRPADRLTAMAHAFRRWSITHRTEFSLMFGEPAPGVTTLDDPCGQAPAGALSFCEAFLLEFAALWQRHQFRTPPTEVISDKLSDSMAPLLKEHGDQLPVEVRYLFLSGWIRLYGMVAMEVFGQLSWVLTDAEPLFETEIAAFLHQLTAEPAG